MNYKIIQAKQKKMFRKVIKMATNEIRKQL